MRTNSTGAVSIIGGADGPTSVFIAGKYQKQSLKLRVQQAIYRHKRKEVEKTIVADPHSLVETVQYAKRNINLRKLRRLTGNIWNSGNV